MALLLVAFAACRGPSPIEANVEFETERGVVRGVSTEDGILALQEIVPTTGALSFRFRSGDSFFDDVATLERSGDSLALLKPKTSRLNLARFAATPAALDDQLYVEVRTARHSDLLAAHLYDEGRRGDLLVLDEGDFGEVAQHYVGTGVYAWRHDELVLVGMLNGVYSEQPRTLAFIGLDEMATLIPASSDYFSRRSVPKRADFEYGIPRDFEGEKPATADDAAPAAESPAPESSSKPAGH